MAATTGSPAHLLLAGSALLLSLGCSGGPAPGRAPDAPAAAPPTSGERTVWYEIFVRSFADGSGDGIGDLAGITRKLDYLADLGVGGVWLTPIFASPSYHGYDTTNYYDVNPQYGSLADLDALVAAAHRRGIRVILDVAVNHTSTQHPWFLESAANKASPRRRWYTWAEDTGRPMPMEGAVPDSVPWHEKNGAHYLGIFHPTMPDLDFDNPEVRSEMVKVGQFWIRRGVDGMRLDAAKHVYEDFHATAKSPETIAKNQEWWKEFRRGLDAVRPGALLIGEVWDRPEVVAPFLRIFQSSFNFDLATKLVTAARDERSQGVGEWLAGIHRAYEAIAGKGWVDAPFLTNHDQNRVMSELGGNVDRARSAASLLLTMPGRPFVYYGEEIGMRGVKPDEAIREPMVWSARPKKTDLQAAWEPIQHNADGKAAVDAQRADPGSLLAHYRRLIAWRNEIAPLRSNTIAPFTAAADAPGVELYLRGDGSERVLVAVNLRPAAASIPVATPDRAFAKVLRSTRDGVKIESGSLVLPGYTTAILE